LKGFAAAAGHKPPAPWKCCSQQQNIPPRRRSTPGGNATARSASPCQHFDLTIAALLPWRGVIASRYAEAAGPGKVQLLSEKLARSRRWPHGRWRLNSDRKVRPGNVGQQGPDLIRLHRYVRIVQKSIEFRQFSVVLHIGHGCLSKHAQCRYPASQSWQGHGSAMNMRWYLPEPTVSADQTEDITAGASAATRAAG
jgi:hypothetical protein